MLGDLPPTMSWIYFAKLHSHITFNNSFPNAESQWQSLAYRWWYQLARVETILGTLNTWRRFDVSPRMESEGPQGRTSKNNDVITSMLCTHSLTVTSSLAFYYPHRQIPASCNRCLCTQWETLEGAEASSTSISTPKTHRQQKQQPSTVSNNNIKYYEWALASRDAVNKHPTSEIQRSAAAFMHMRLRYVSSILEALLPFSRKSGVTTSATNRNFENFNE